MGETNSNLQLQEWLKIQKQDATKNRDDDLASKIQDAAAHFDTCDPKTTCDNYIIAKTNSDPVSASKCILLLFEPLFRQLSQQPQVASQLKLSATINQLREELSILLSELKSNNLKLKASSAPASIASRQTPSMNPSPMLSPRVKFGSDDRLSSRDSASKTSDGHLHSSSRIIFYNQLFETLPLATRRAILFHFIDHSDNQFEACRLIMLGFVLLGCEFKNYAHKLLKTLIELAENNSSKKQPTISSQQTTEEKLQASQIFSSNPRQLMMCRYARSLLVLDAIPITLDYLDTTSIELYIDEVFNQVLRLYSDQCLESSSNEYEIGELHEGVKKTIASKILGYEMHSGSKDPSEELITQTFSHLTLKVIEDYKDKEYSTKLTSLRTIVTTKQSQADVKRVQEILDIVKSFYLQPIEEKDETTSRQLVTTPPKTRGRPKKKQPASNAEVEIIATTKGTESITPNKISPTKIVFYSLIEFIFNNCVSYLRSTKSRMLVNIDNRKVLAGFDSKPQSRTTKTTRANAPDAVGPSSAKQAKMAEDKPYKTRGLSIEQSPLDSEHSRKMDQQVLMNLSNAKEILDFLESSTEPSLNGLWLKFKETYRLNELGWFNRIQIDSSIMTGSYNEAVEILQSLIDRDNDDDKDANDNDNDLNTSSSTSTSDLRRLTQLLSCNVQLAERADCLSTIDKLILVMKSSELLKPDENEYACGNIISEYVIHIDDNLGFLFLDTLSILRFCSDILMEICENYVNSNKLVCDAAIGHTIVLSQFDWPKEVNIYRRCIDWIRDTKPKSTTPQYLSASTKFTYPEFFHYVRNPNVIEDFMALLCQSYTLDVRDTNGLVTPISSAASVASQVSSGGSAGQSSLGGAQSSSSQGTPGKPGASSSRSVKAITTRGVNKTFKEDLKVAMVAQMRCSSNLISLDMISEFIRLSVLPYMRQVFGAA